jgi:hypothetical protein
MMRLLVGRTMTQADRDALTRYKQLPADHPLLRKIFVASVPKRSDSKTSLPPLKTT